MEFYSAINKNENKTNKQTLSSPLLLVMVFHSCNRKPKLTTFIFVYTQVHMCRSEDNFQESPLLLSCGPRASNAGHQASWQPPLPTEPPLQPFKTISEDKKSIFSSSTHAVKLSPHPASFCFLNHRPSSIDPVKTSNSHVGQSLKCQSLKGSMVMEDTFILPPLWRS